MYYLKKLHMVGFEVGELRKLHKADSLNLMREIMDSKGWSLDSLRKDGAKMLEIVNLSKQKRNNKEDIEIFSALFFFSDFYKNTKILFPLKSTTNINDIKIVTLDALKKHLREDTSTDFAFMMEDGLRQFQLKQYRGDISTEAVFNFIKKKLAHYGNDLGNVNLILILQKEGGDISNIDFEALNLLIVELKLKSNFHVLISYNEENKFDVIITVYPKFGSVRIPVNLGQFY